MTQQFDPISYFRILKTVVDAEFNASSNSRNIENDMLRSIAQSMNVSGMPQVTDILSGRSEPYSLEEAATLPEGSKRAAIRDALLIAYADNLFTESEDKTIHDICLKIGISESFYNEAKDWAAAYIRVLSDGARLFG